MKRVLPVGLFALIFALFLASTPEAQVRIKRGFTTVTTLLLGDGTVAAPSLAFANATSTGFHRGAGTNDLVLGLAGANRMRWVSTDIRMSSGAILGWASAEDVENNAMDTSFSRGAAGILNAYTTGDIGIRFQFAAVPSITTVGITGDGFGGGASILTGSTDTFGFIRVGAGTEGIIAFATDWGTNLQQGCTANNEDGTPTYAQVTDKTMRLAGGTRAVPVAWTSASVVNWICGGAK